jgi:type I restriction enzyme S subunit
MKTNNKNNLVPNLRFPEFRDAGAWEEISIDNVLLESRTPSNTNDPNKRITVRLNQKGVEKREVRGTESENATYFFVRKKGQFIYGKQNLHKGAFGIIPDELDGFESSQDIPSFDFKKDFSPEYFLCYLGQENIFPSLEKISTGTGSKRIQPKEFLKIRFPFPTLAEQQKIATCLSSLDNLIAAQTQKLETLKTHKRSLMQQLFPAAGKKTPQLRFPEFKNAGEWEEKKLGDCLLQSPDYGMNAAAVPYSDNLPMYLRITDISEDGQFLKDKKVSVDKKVSDTNYLQVGDIVLARTGASVGKSYKYKAIDGKLVFAGFLIRIKPDGNKLDSEFLYQFLLTSQYWNWVDFTSARSGQPGINGNEYSSMPLFLPSLSEQRKIATCLSSLDSLIAAQAQKIESLKTQKKGLMQGLFPKIEER